MEQRQQEQLAIWEGEIRVVEPLEMTFLGGDLYRLEETPIFLGLEAYLGDTIKGVLQENGTLLFKLVVNRSSLHHWDWLFTKSIAESSALVNLKRMIEEHGGKWEHVFGGGFLVHLPEESPFDPEAEIKKWKI